jgi:hypothetical protein
VLDFCQALPKQFHIGVQLQHFSIKVGTDDGHGMEAHLVCVGSTLDILANATSRGKLTMGSMPSHVLFLGVASSGEQ